MNWTPPLRTLPPVERLKFWEMVMPPASWKAELMPPAIATVLLPAPRAAELEAMTTPWLIVRVPSQFGFGAASTRVPTSSFQRFAVGLPPKGVLRVRVLPVSTWIQLFVLTRLMTRLLVQVSIARKPALFRMIWLDGSPRAESEVAAMKPAVREIRLPRKVLPGLESTNEPLPSLMMSPAPVMRPENVPAWTTLEEWVALARL